MRIAQVAAEAEVNVQTLRYYERRGLLAEPERLSSGYRDYGSDAVRVVRFAKRAQQLGFSLDEVETLLGLAEGGPDSCEAALHLAGAKVAQLDEKLASLRAMRSSLVCLIQTCSLPREERICPLLQSLEAG